MKVVNKYFFMAHVFLAALLWLVIFVPNARSTTCGYGPLLVVIALMEGFFLFSIIGKGRKRELNNGPYDIIIFLWIAFIAWELFTSVLNLAHPVLVPAPENVFNTFIERWDDILLNVWYSLRLLAVGFFSGLSMAVILGLVAGWIPRIRNFIYPIANVMTPIPPIVFSPYLVALMPTFRSASILVILLGVFWPTFLTTINRVNSIEPQILDSARMLGVSNNTMIWKILLPYIFPGVISGLKVSVTTSLLMLNFAELMGATHGMGYFVQNSITYANYTNAVAGIIVIGIVVTILNRLVSVLQVKVVRWR